jgi:hypothetical protein
MALGGVLSMFDKRYRSKKKAKVAPAKADKVEENQLSESSYKSNVESETVTTGANV